MRPILRGTNLIPGNASLGVLIKRVHLVFDYPFKMVHGTAALLYSSCTDHTKAPNMTQNQINCGQFLFFFLKQQMGLLPSDFSSECAKAKLSTNTTSTSNTNCCTSEFSSLRDKKYTI